MRAPNWTRYRSTRDPIDPHLLELAKAERATQAGVTNEALSNINVAVARVRVGDGPAQYLSSGNQRTGPHAEQWIQAQMQELGRGGQRVTLEQLYSERIPCVGNCGPWLTRHHPNAQIYFTTSRHGRAAGTELKKAYGLPD